MSAWDEAVEGMMHRYPGVPPTTFYDICNLVLPYARRMLAEELRAAPVTTSSRGNTFGAGWQSAADHLTRPEVMK